MCSSQGRWTQARRWDSKLYFVQTQKLRHWELTSGWQSLHDGILMGSSVLIGSPSFFHCTYFLHWENGHLAGMSHESLTKSMKGIVYLRHLVRFSREWEKNSWTAISDSWNWSLRLGKTDPHSRDGSPVDEEAGAAPMLSCLGHYLFPRCTYRTHKWLLSRARQRSQPQLLQQLSSKSF